MTETPAFYTAAPRWQALMRESDMQDALRVAAKRCGWSAYHAYDSRRSDPGFPDLCLVKGDRIVFLELKAQKGRVQPAQRHWLDKLAKVPGVTAAVVRPEPREGEISYDEALELLGAER